MVRGSHLPRRLPQKHARAAWRQAASLHSRAKSPRARLERLLWHEHLLVGQRLGAFFVWSHDSCLPKTPSSTYIKHKTTKPEPEDFLGNLESLLKNHQGEFIGPETQSPWLRPHPIGFRRLLNWISNRYGKPTIYVTENGTSIKGENDLPKEEILKDDFRVQYFDGYINAMADAVAEDGVDVRGYVIGFSIFIYASQSLSSWLFCSSHFALAAGGRHSIGIRLGDSCLSRPGPDGSVLATSVHGITTRTICNGSSDS